ncbi:MAG: alpha/beta hydrolase fold domain-containing protein [Stappiaceae bacterium]
MSELDETVFLPGAGLEETRQFNHDLIRKLESFPDPWSSTPVENRQKRLQGIGPFPAPEFSERAQNLTIEGPRGPLVLRLLTPTSGPSNRAFLHIHGGGWMYGSAAYQDARLQEMADRADCNVFSVEYGLAPESPYPAAPDDCECAARWLTGEGARLHQLEQFAIGGESAGAHLSVVTLLRMRDRHKTMPFNWAVLVAGCYDLGLTPSAASFGEERLLLTTRDIKNFSRNYLGNHANTRLSDVSPLYADLRNLTSAMFIVGTRDALLDDTLFMHSRWIASNNSATIKIFAEGCHVFNTFPLKISDECNKMIDDYLFITL